jgi:8-oxo-dGTP diphosphatase
MNVSKILQTVYLQILAMLRHSFKIGAFALIFDEEQRVLLCHRSDVDLWNLPGGKVERNEKPRRAVVREVKEETRVKVRVRRLAGVYINFGRAVLRFVYICEIVKGRPGVSDETDESAYFALTKFPRYTYPDHRQWVEDVLANPTRLHLKIQSGLSAKKLLKQGKL